MEIQIREAPPISPKKIRTCAYCRVSSEHDEQLTSVENQKNYYRKKIGDDPRYELTEIYCDSGISGRREDRPEFQRMLNDARTGKFEIIITKSISRFARNTDTMLKATRELKALGIGVYFELQDMNTLDMDGELLLTIYAAFAQAESESVSDLLALSHLRRVQNQNHNATLCNLFGYSKDKNGEYSPDENAEWVRRIFEMSAARRTPTQIARYLNEQGVKPVFTEKFSDTVVAKIIRNCSYKGDTIRTHYYEDKDGIIHRNDGTKPPLYVRNTHTAIISPELWQRAQDGMPLSNKERRKRNLAVPREILTEKLGKYRKRIYCAKCGYVMHGSIAKRENLVYFHCYGQGAYGREFCPAWVVPLSAVELAGEFEGNLYFDQTLNEWGEKIYPFVSESEWKSQHTKKDAPHHERDMETATLEGRIFCKRCGSPMLRRAASHSKNRWICEGNKKHGVDFCKGLVLPDEFLKGKIFSMEKIYVKERCLDGKKHYYYSTKYGKETEL